MRSFRSFAVLATALTILTPSLTDKVSRIYAQETTISEDAQLLYDEAVEFKKKGKTSQAVDSYMKALRIDRTILALDDNGLIDASYKDCMDKLSKSPNDVKLLETCGFLSSVGYSDNATAITYYEKIIELVDDESVKEKTKGLIERLKASAEAQQSYDSEVSASMRDERLKTWAEMEKLSKFSEDQAEAAERAEKLSNAYSDRESLQNTVPQLEEELNQLQEDYDKADRLWYTLKDELYERRRRRLKNDLAAKKEELQKAKNELAQAEREVTRLEREDNDYKAAQSQEPFNNLQEKPEQDENSAFNEDVESNRSLSSNISDESSSESDESEENSDEPQEEASDDNTESSDEELSEEKRQEQIDNLIDNL